MRHNVRAQQLRERDVRQLAPSLETTSFLKMYIESNFPQTSALPSVDQKGMQLGVQSMPNELQSIKKPPSGTSFDKPGLS
jgi:hypothetical protein